MVPCLGVIIVVLSESFIDGRMFGAELVLELRELLQTQRVLQVSLEETILLLDDLYAASGEVSHFGRRRGGEPVEFVVEHAAKCVLRGGADLDALVVVDDEVFDVADEDCRLRAVGAFLMASETYEVGVDGTVAGLGVVDHEPGSALAAVDAAFEIVVMFLCAIPGGVVRAQNGLHLVPDLGFNESIMGSVVANTSVDDVAFVVRVLQHPVHG